MEQPPDKPFEGIKVYREAYEEGLRQIKARQGQGLPQVRPVAAARGGLESLPRVVTPTPSLEERILSFLRESPGSTVDALRADIHEDIRAVLESLENLEKWGVVRVDRSGEGPRLFATGGS